VKKIVKASTDKKKPATVRQYKPDPDCFFSYKKMPISRSLIEHMIDELPDWPINNPMEKSLTEFYLKYHIGWSTRQGLLKRHPDLKEAEDVANSRISERLWAAHAEENWSALKHRLHSYGPEWVANDNYQVELKVRSDKSSESSGNIYIGNDSMKINK